MADRYLARRCYKAYMSCMYETVRDKECSTVEEAIVVLTSPWERGETRRQLALWTSTGRKWNITNTRKKCPHGMDIKWNLPSVDEKITKKEV